HEAGGVRDFRGPVERDGMLAAGLEILERHALAGGAGDDARQALAVAGAHAGGLAALGEWGALRAPCRGRAVLVHGQCSGSTPTMPWVWVIWPCFEELVINVFAPGCRPYR